MNKFSIRNRWLEKIWKNNGTIGLNVLYAKKEKAYILLKFQNITQVLKNKLFL